MFARELEFRESLISQIPKKPNKPATVRELNSLSTKDICLLYLTWKSRLVPLKKRIFSVWEKGFYSQISPEEFTVLEEFRLKVQRGEDLNPHLSRNVRTDGYILSTLRYKNPDKHKYYDRDTILIRMGFHHFHIGKVSPENKKGRSGYIIFARVTDDHFEVIAIAPHGAFDQNSEYFMYLFNTYELYRKQKITPGALYTNTPITVDGFSSDLDDYAIYCVQRVREMDSLLDNIEYIRDLFKKYHPKAVDNPSVNWWFKYLDLGLKDSAGNFIPIIQAPKATLY